MQTVGIGDVLIAIAAILFVAAYVIVRSFERYGIRRTDRRRPA
jgi:hypothetical protein